MPRLVRKEVSCDLQVLLNRCQSGASVTAKWNQDTNPLLGATTLNKKTHKQQVRSPHH